MQFTKDKIFIILYNVKDDVQIEGMALVKAENWHEARMAFHEMNRGELNVINYIESKGINEEEPTEVLYMFENSSKRHWANAT